MKLESLKNLEKFQILRTEILQNVNGGSGGGSQTYKENGKVQVKNSAGESIWVDGYRDVKMSYTSDDSEGCFWGISYDYGNWQVL